MHLQVVDAIEEATLTFRGMKPIEHGFSRRRDGERYIGISVIAHTSGRNVGSCIGQRAAKEKSVRGDAR